ncbi:MAG: TMEM175 family protein [Pyrinomonadaceae bacterium]
MNNSHENTTLSFERILFFSDAVFAIVITLLVLELKVPNLGHEDVTNADLRHALFDLIPKFLGFIYSFFIVGLMWIEHHRIFRHIGSYDFGLIWRNLIFLLFVAFIPFPTALFSEYYRTQTAFVLYALSFAFAALGKIWIWTYAVKNRETLMVSEIDDETIKQISRRSWAVPIVCAFAIGLSFIAIAFGGFAFPLIPLVANLLYRRKKEAAA